jgi:hypothetical protein
MKQIHLWLLLAWLHLRAAWWAWALRSIPALHMDAEMVEASADQARIDLVLLRWDLGLRA